MEKTKTIKKVAAVKAEPKAGKLTAKKVSMREKGNTRKQLTGTIVSTKMQNTVVVLVARKVAHKLYGKLIKVSKKIKADTNGMELTVGDTVIIEQTKPISKEKFFRVIRKENSA